MHGKLVHPYIQQKKLSYKYNRQACLSIKPQITTTKMDFNPLFSILQRNKRQKEGKVI